MARTGRVREWFKDYGTSVGERVGAELINVNREALDQSTDSFLSDLWKRHKSKIFMGAALFIAAIGLVVYLVTNKNKK
jgi:hypothetical protein